MKFLITIILADFVLLNGLGYSERLVLEPAPGMTRAELHYVKIVASPRAVLVLCPGVNGNAEKTIHSKVWQEWAKQNDVSLVGLSFASTIQAIQDGTGYYYASKGSGEKLLEGIRLIFGKNLPLLLYGFSGGAQFVSRFEEWNPEHVASWCAYSAQWWDKPRISSVNPPGIVACGENDPRLGASLVYFKQGRASGKPWLWVELKDTSHEESPVLNEFVRVYFSVMLRQKLRAPVWVDVETEDIVSESFAEPQPTITAWLPNSSLYPLWTRVHLP